MQIMHGLPGLLVTVFLSHPIILLQDSDPCKLQTFISKNEAASGNIVEGWMQGHIQNI